MPDFGDNNGAQNTVLPHTLLKEVLNFIHANVHDLMFTIKYELNSFCYYFPNLSSTYNYYSRSTRRS